jgi:hypothetical protein
MNNQNPSKEEAKSSLEKQQALLAKRIISMHQQVALAMMTGQMRPNQDSKPDK